MKTVVCDIEGDGLLDKITKVHVIGCVDADGNNRKFFTDQPEKVSKEPAGTLEEGVEYLLTYDRIVCHFITGYDTHVFNRFWPHLWNLKTVPFSKMWDTLIQSRAQWFDRFHIPGVKGNHGLEYYGALFKYPKPPIEDWSEFNDEMLHRNLEDIEINRRAYHYLNKEAEDIGLDFTQQIRRASATQYWNTIQELNGWLADREFLVEKRDELDVMIKELADEIEPLLPPIIKAKAPKCTWENIRDKWDSFYRKVPPTQHDEDGKPTKEAYTPTTRVFLKKKKNQPIQYDRHTAKHFDIDQEARKSDYMIMAPYTKIEINQAKMSQHAVVKDYLLSIGWQPTQWNFKKNARGKIERDDRGQPIKTSPKLTEDSYDSIEGELGKKIANYNTYCHRRRTIENEKSNEKGWLNLLRDDGKISAGAMAFCTSTGRAVQTGIVNIPSAQALFGKPMRQAWIASEGHKIVSVDQDSAQLRLLANYMGDQEFTKAVMEGQEYDENGVYLGTDAHTFNGRLFGLISEGDWMMARETQDEELLEKIAKARKKAKNGIYCLLFGGGDEKFAITIGLYTASQGKSIKEDYFTRLPKMKLLLNRLKKQWKENPWKGGGYIQVAGGAWVWCRSEHALLNYCLMGSEAQIQNEAICWSNMQNIKRGLSGKMLATIHDEMNWEFPLEEEDGGKKLLSEAYGVASKRFQLEVPITGTAASGFNWAEVH